MNALKIKKGDTVVVISGKDRGKRGKVVRTEAETGKLVVEAPLYASKVMAVCPKCKEPTRVAYKVDDKGEKTRVCRHCGAAL